MTEQQSEEIREQLGRVHHVLGCLIVWMGGAANTPIGPTEAGELLKMLGPNTVREP